MIGLAGIAAKGEEFGYFQFGGSDIILLLQTGIDADVVTTEGFRPYGTRAVHAAPTHGGR